jgi:dihydroorotase
VPELCNLIAQVDAYARAVAGSAEMVIGVKVRMSENVVLKHGLEPLKGAITICERAGTGAKGSPARALMSQILDLLCPSDVLTHAYSATGWVRPG